MTNRKFAFIAQDPNTDTPSNQTTWALMQAAQASGDQVFWLQPSDLHLHHNQAVGFMAPVSVQAGSPPSLQLGDSFLAPLGKLDAVFWREPGPYNWDHLFALDLLQTVVNDTRVLNAPSSLKSLHPHLFAKSFAHLLPPTLVTNHVGAAEAFLAEAGGKVTIRSLHGSNRTFFLRVGDPNLKALVETLTEQGTQYVLLQKLVTEPGLDGDKRLFFLQGELLGAALQVPPVGELRGTFETGAKAESIQVSTKDVGLAQTLGPALRAQGIYFASVDVSDGQIIDLNLSCPCGLPQLQEVANNDVISPILANL
ncbi:MAG: hypothetical protein EP343_13535 [Deltaproteobacteria bacterium]|nr:MAG: hypothetical protein EP343_13535 [Deltaproteobacteria bacterium]